MPAGLFFAAVALFQLIWARVVLVRTTIPVLTAGIMLNLGAIALWALSRTAGAPFGPNAGEAEVVQAADLCALLLQIYVVMGAGWVWYRGLQGEPVPVFGSAMVLMGAVSVVALASAVGVASGLRHGDHAPSGAAGGHHGTAAEAADVDHHGTSSEPEEGSDRGTSAEHADGHDGGHPESVISPQVSLPDGEPATPAPAGAPAPSAVPVNGSHGDHDHGD